MLQIAVPKETATHEKRVALSPAAVSQLIKNEHRVLIEKGAGRLLISRSRLHRCRCYYCYESEGCIFKADLLLAVQTPSDDEIAKWKRQYAHLFSMGTSTSRIGRKTQNLGITALGMDAIQGYPELKIWMLYPP